MKAGVKAAWRAFWRGFSNTFGVFPVVRYVETPEESLLAVRKELREAIELARRHDMAPRRWLLPNGDVVGEAISREAVDLMRDDPVEYWRRRGDVRRLR